MGEEMKAWEFLKSVEEKLKDLLGDLVEGNGNGDGGVRPKVRKPTGKSKGGKGTKKVESKNEDEEGRIGGAAEFARWCQESVSQTSTN